MEACWVALPLAAAAAVVAGAAAIFGGERTDNAMSAFWEGVKKYGPYAVGIGESIVVGLHSSGVIGDQTFATASALHGAAAVPAVKLLLQHVVRDAIMRKATVQIDEVAAAGKAVLPTTPDDVAAAVELVRQVKNLRGAAPEPTPRRVIPTPPPPVVPPPVQAPGFEETDPS